MLQVIHKTATCRCTLERGAQIAQDTSAFPIARPAVGGVTTMPTPGGDRWPALASQVWTRAAVSRAMPDRSLVAGTVRRCRVSIADPDLSPEDPGDVEVARDS
jgi:hypothetical protein